MLPFPCILSRCLSTGNVHAKWSFWAAGEFVSIKFVQDPHGVHVAHIYEPVQRMCRYVSNRSHVCELVASVLCFAVDVLQSAVFGDQTLCMCIMFLLPQVSAERFVCSRAVQLASCVPLRQWRKGHVLFID